ncbi:MAG: nitroreductase family protein [Clostridia bacterium]|nr:nitroreductase family protein [Clostridia bacterium]
MELKNILNERSSMRVFQDREIPRETINAIVEMASRAPSWKNTQLARYIIIQDKELIKRFATKEVTYGFEYNIKTIEGAAALAIQCLVKGQSGYDKDGTYSTLKGDAFQYYDSGISGAIFSLAAFDQGVGTVIQGYFDENEIRKLVDIPEDQEVIALIPMGYPGKDYKPSPRKDIDEILTYL